MMASEFVDLAATHAHSAADGELARRPPARRSGRRTIRWCSAAARRPPGSSLLTRRFGIRGYATSVHTACASGGQALGTALKLIRRGAVDCVLAGGFDSMISPIGIGGFCLLSALSPDNDTPQRASRPFDATRNGFLLGEGAGFLVLEEWNVGARARRAHLRRARRRRQFAVELPDHRLAARRRRADPGDARGARRRRRDAGGRRLPERARHVDADERPQRKRGDAAPCSAPTSMRVTVSSTKSTMGHLIAAAGAVEVAVCALAIARGEMPINANLVERDPDCDLNFVTGAPRRAARPRRDVEFVRLRRLEQLRRAAPSRRRSTGRRA